MFSVEKKQTGASWPRGLGSTVLPHEKLQLAYNKYKTTSPIPENAIRFNLAFMHGTGMTKAIYHYHIKKLYTVASQQGWYLDSVVSIDAVGHGDSAPLNTENIGWAYHWDDGGRDLIEVLKHEQDSGDFQNDPLSRNIAIGHSMGGLGVIIAAVNAPALFDSIILLDPVTYANIKYQQLFLSRFKKVAKLIIDTFASKDEIDDYYRKFSFFKTLNGEVLDDLINDDVYQVGEPGSRDTVYKSKTSNKNQMACYMSAAFSVIRGMNSLPLLEVPVCHVIPVKGAWNPPESIGYIRGNIKKDLLTPVDLPEGGHLFHAELPDTTVDTIVSYISQRKLVAEDLYPSYPQVRFHGDKAKIFDDRMALVLDARAVDSLDPKAKL